MSASTDSALARPLRLRPFRGMRYDAAAVGDIGAVTSPPYDVMDRPMIDGLLADHTRNIVRLILPRMVCDPVTDADPYAIAAARLERWRTRGVLATDDRPGIYVYQYGDDDHSVCGLVGALELREPEEGIVLPHEDVIAGIVADRLAMMEASQANLEPILLVYEGGGETADVIQRARSRSALTDVSAADGTFHRLWVVDDPADLALLDQLLAPHQALIADGHHRYATYRRLQHDRRRSGDGAGPWDRGLALLIDQSQCPLQLGPIHRSVAELRLVDLVAPAGFVLSSAEPTTEHPGGPSDPRAFILTDGLYERRLTWVGDEPVDLSEPEPTSDAELLHERVLPAWSIAEDRIGYHHTISQAVRNAHQDGGVAVLMHPTTVEEVMQVAKAGRIMPRKSTSFGPKPRMGLVMRSFADES